MHIVVCVKQVPDWDIPPSSFKIDESLKQVVPPPGVVDVPSQFDMIGVDVVPAAPELLQDPLACSSLLTLRADLRALDRARPDRIRLA